MKPVPAISVPFQKFVLPSGLTLLVTRNAAAPVVSMAAYCDAGILCEPEEKAGLANLTAALLDEGSARRSGEALSEELESVGGHLETGPSGASLGVPCEELDRGVRILAELMTAPVFPESALCRKKEQILSEIVGDEDDPKTKAFHAFHELVYGRHPLHRPSYGYKNTVSRLRRADLVTYHRRFYAPERMILGVSGAVSPQLVHRTVTRYFGKWNHKAAPKPAIPAIPKQRGPRLRVIREDREQVNLYLGHAGIARTNPDYYRLLVMDHILGTGPGFTDRLSRKLRDEQGLAYTVYAGIASSAGKEPGTFAAYMGTSAKNFRRAVRGIQGEIRAMRSAAPADHEMRLAKDYLTGSYIFGVERNLGRALFLINQERFGLGEDYLKRYPRTIESVSRQEVLEAARRHLQPASCALVAVGPVDSAKGLI